MIYARGAALGRDARFRFEQASFQQALQCRIKRAFFDLEEIIRNLFDVFRERIAMHRFKAEGMKNHQFERAGKEIALIWILWHDERESPAEHPQHDITAIGAQSHAHCNFAGAASGILSSNSIELYTRQDKRKESEK